VSQVSNRKWALIIALVMISAVAASAYALLQSSEKENTEPTVEEKVVLDYAAGFNQTLQQKVIDGFKASGKVTSEQVQQIAFLKTLPYAQQVSSIVNGTFTNTDWDGDRINNRPEQIMGMPWNVHNGRYALIVETTNYTEGVNNMYNFLTKEQKFSPENVITLAYTNATKENFQQAVSNLSHKVGGNDIVFIGLSGHGDDGVFIFNDGKGNPQAINAAMHYKDIDARLDTIKSNATVIDVSACGQVSALEPLKDGPSPRVVTTIGTDWISAVSKNYTNSFIQCLPIQFDPVKPKEYDIDGNGYVSIGESFETMMKSMKRYLSEYPDQAVKYGIMDTSNISKRLFLGGFSVSD
jgi:hypothetical protein